jgi:hypothetical protein
MIIRYRPTKFRPAAGKCGLVVEALIEVQVPPGATNDYFTYFKALTGRTTIAGERWCSGCAAGTGCATATTPANTTKMTSNPTMRNVAGRLRINQITAAA